MGRRPKPFTTVRVQANKAQSLNRADSRPCGYGRTISAYDPNADTSPSATRYH
jgi:hypothetical protein